MSSFRRRQRKEQTNKQTLCSKLFLGRNSRRSLEWTSRPSPRFFFLPHRSTVATDMHLNRSLLPFLPPSLLSADMAESPHVSRPIWRAQHSLTKNNKHIQTIQCLQRPCSRDARLPFFSSGRRPPKLGRRPQCYIFFTFQQCSRWKYKQQTTEVFYCNFTDFGRLTPCFRTKTSAF